MKPWRRWPAGSHGPLRDTIKPHFEAWASTPPVKAQDSGRAGDVAEGSKGEATTSPAVAFQEGPPCVACGEPTSLTDAQAARMGGAICWACLWWNESRAKDACERLSPSGRRMVRKHFRKVGARVVAARRDPASATKGLAEKLREIDRRVAAEEEKEREKGSAP